MESSPTSSMNMHPELANRLFSEGAVLIIAGVPVGTEFGIDFSTYTIGEKFRGIKMIPAGPHYIYCASTGPYGDCAPRVGFAHYFHRSEILVREWDANNEELRERQIKDPELEIQRIRENLKDLDRYLGAYDYRKLQRWRNITDKISEHVIKRCVPETGIIRTNVELLSCTDEERPRGKDVMQSKLSSGTCVDENDLLPNLKPVPGTAPRFTILPDRIPKNSSAADITKHHMDSITAVDLLIQSYTNFDLLLEEIQFTFILFMPGCSVEALVHWRKVLNILCNSESAILKYRLFYLKYMEVLQHQLPELPEELMEQNDKNTVYKDIRNLVINSTLGGLNVSADRFTKSLLKSMKWTFDSLFDEDPDDLPVIVEL